MLEYLSIGTGLLEQPCGREQLIRAGFQLRGCPHNTMTAVTGILQHHLEKVDLGKRRCKTQQCVTLFRG